VLRKEDDDWMKKCSMEYEEEGPRGRPKRTWTEAVERTAKYVH